MRVISMVPSWTETLIEAGVDVVGRTEHCIHPADRVQQIPIVGGTKKVDWERVTALQADLLLLDKEENPRSMADRSPIPIHATHIRSVEDVPRELAGLVGRMECQSSVAGLSSLLSIAERWGRVMQRPQPAERSLAELPGVIKCVRPPGPQCQRFVYLVWRDPWMAVGPATFIGSMFARLGYGDAHLAQGAKYPVVDLERFDRRRTLLLFSSEPYPFASHPELMRDCGFAAALVDGELYSWFGTRSLRFLEQYSL